MEQVTSHIMMIRPAAFGYNTETADDNVFQHRPVDIAPDELITKARQEFDAFVGLLRYEGIDVTVVEDSTQPVKPDAVFPNNWITFHDDGTVITYPMYSPVRRQERREEIIDQIGEKFKIKDREHFEFFEEDDQYLEGTGSLVLDRVNKIAYACMSERTDRELLEDWCDRMGYTPHTFYAESNDKPIYHTNVMMAIASKVVIVCLSCLPDKAERIALWDSLARHHDIIEITNDQLRAFAGNMLALKNNRGEELMIMSESALESLTREQQEKISRYCRIVAARLPVIENIGGGSARCMIAEIFLPVKNN